MLTSTAKGAPRGPAARRDNPCRTFHWSHAASQARELAGLKTNHSPSVGFQLEQVPGLVEHGAVRGQAPTTQGDGGTL